MVKKQYIKSTRRLFFKHIIRLLSIAAIFVVSIGLMSGLGIVKYNVRGYVDDVYHTCNVHDLKIINSPTEPDLKELYETLNTPENKEKYSIKDLELNFTYEYDSDNERYAKRLCFMDFNGYKDRSVIDKLILLKDGVSRYPENENEAIVLEKTNDIKQHNINETITIPKLGKTVTVVGIAKNPTILGKSREPSSKFDPTLTPDKQVHGYLDDYIYIQSSTTPVPYPDELLITFKDNIRNDFNCLSKNYLNLIAFARGKISGAHPNIPENQILSLEQCFSFNSLIKYADKVAVIAGIFIGFFSLITLLVVFSTMTRLFDEDRASMAVLKTLGYSNFAISMRYVAFVVIAGLLGSVLAIVPSMIVNNMIIGGFMMQYNLWKISLPVINGMFFFCAGLILLLSIIITVITSLIAADKKPIELLTPKTPKVGKKILLEKIRVIWSKLSFKYKSTCRNVFLFKGRFFMTFFSIIASTTIVFASLALFDNSVNNISTGMDTSALKIISLVLLVFSGILCALVVYNITNINISERRREIATLMVLGYRNAEVKGYIYREIYIMAILSALVGLPAGVGFTYFVFNFMDFGSLGYVNWWTYILTPIITLIFAFLATLLLSKKITNTDMNDSLKVLE